MNRRDALKTMLGAAVVAAASPTTALAVEPWAVHPLDLAPLLRGTAWDGTVHMTVLRHHKTIVGYLTAFEPNRPPSEIDGHPFVLSANVPVRTSDGQRDLKILTDYVPGDVHVTQWINEASSPGWTSNGRTSIRTVATFTGAK